MSLTELTVKLLLLFLPGIVCYMTVDALAVHRERKVHEIFLLSFVYGLLSYFVFFPLASLSHTAIAQRLYIPPARLTILKCLCDKDVPINWWEVGLTTGLALLLGIVISTAHDRDWLHRVARKLRITRKFGQKNVWAYVLNIPDVKWATVRDLSNNLMFQGYILAFTDIEEPTEIFLTNVNVYNEKTGHLLYQADTMYLARERKNLTVEFPVVKT
jgi:hypothetical protein